MWCAHRSSTSAWAGVGCRRGACCRHATNDTVSEPLAAVTEAFAGRFPIERELGTGPLCVNYLASEAAGRRASVVSVLRPEVAAALETDRFLARLEPARRVQYPNLHAIADAGIAGPYVYFARRGGSETARDRLAAGPLRVTDTVRIVWDVVDALSYAHDEHLLHLGLRPDCIELSTRHVMLAEVGVAGAARDAGLATAGIAFADPAYVAPEVAAGEPPDARADFYAVGAVAYELVLGHPPYQGATQEEIEAARRAGAPPSLADERPSVPPLFAQLVARCLEPNPADRWPSAGELLPQLAALSSLGRVSVGLRRPDLKDIDRKD